MAISRFAQPESRISSDLAVADLRVLSLAMLGRALRIFSLSDDSGSASIRREPPPLLRLRTEEEEAAALRLLVNQIREERPLDAMKIAEANRIIQAVLDSSKVSSALSSLEDVRKFIAQLQPSVSSVGPNAPMFTTVVAGDRFTVETVAALIPRKDIADALQVEIAQQRFVASVMQMCFDRRASGSMAFSADEEIAIERAYRLLDEGVRLPRVFEPIRHTRKRRIQTYVSFADPGDGHLAVTVRDSKLLDGLIVHIEYIDRDGVDNKELVEAYRLPAIRNAARVRLHVGNVTPCTAFIGRPVFEGDNFDLGLLKAGHTMASVCSAMFSQGVADCKVAMDHMSARQAVDFMRIVAGNVVRDSLTQSLSAAFNINSVLRDDVFSRGMPRDLTNRLEIAETAVRLAAMGRFNKIAWDGASNERPGKAILVGQIKRVELLKLVHEAHARGLETYISAGMKPEHMRDAVCVGVGGVGIGTSLHHRTADGTIGEIDPAKVRDVLAIQKAASESIAGKAASYLAQSDWQYAEGSLRPSLNPLRLQLFGLLSDLLATLDAQYPDEPLPGSAGGGGPTMAEAKIQGLMDQLANLQPAKSPLVTAENDQTPRSRSAVPKSPAAVLESFVDDSERDPVELWAIRVVEANTGEAAESRLSKKVIEKIQSLLKARDLEGLRRLYPL